MIRTRHLLRWAEPGNQAEQCQRQQCPFKAPLLRAGACGFGACSCPWAGWWGQGAPHGLAAGVRYGQPQPVLKPVPTRMERGGENHPCRPEGSSTCTLKKYVPAARSEAAHRGSSRRVSSTGFSKRISWPVAGGSAGLLALASAGSPWCPIVGLQGLCRQGRWLLHQLEGLRCCKRALVYPAPAVRAHWLRARSNGPRAVGRRTACSCPVGFHRAPGR